MFFFFFRLKELSIWAYSFEQNRWRTGFYFVKEVQEPQIKIINTILKSDTCIQQIVWEAQK